MKNEFKNSFFDFSLAIGDIVREKQRRTNRPKQMRGESFICFIGDLVAATFQRPLKRARSSLGRSVSTPSDLMRLWLDTLLAEKVKSALGLA